MDRGEVVIQEKYYKPKEFARKVGVTVKTLQRWDNTGVLKANRTPTSRRYYTDRQLEQFLQGPPTETASEGEQGTENVSAEAQGTENASAEEQGTESASEEKQGTESARESTSVDEQ